MIKTIDSCFHTYPINFRDALEEVRNEDLKCSDPAEHPDAEGRDVAQEYFLAMQQYLSSNGVEAPFNYHGANIFREDPNELG